ncbi:MAG: DUF4382 domain-containing protein [Planctomycetota bacterium]|jgi:hypothetical protein
MRQLSWIVLLSLVAGCDIGSPDFYAFGTNNTFRSTGTAGVSSGGLTAVAVWLSDSPVDGADRVWVTIDRVLLDHIVLVDQRRTVDLLQLRNGVRTLLADANVPPGRYESLRIELATGSGLLHWVEADGRTHPLLLAAGAQPALGFDGDYRLGAGEELELQLDFNVRLSVYEAGGIWYLDPEGFLHDAKSAGAIEGTALPAGTVVSAQRDGEEHASTRSGPDGFFRIVPVAPGRYDLVASRKGHVPQARESVRVNRSESSRGHHFLLAPAAPGSVQGTYFAISSPGLTIRIRWQGKYFGIAGVDPATGAFYVDGLPPELLEFEVWDRAGPLGPRTNILVDPGFDSLLEFR